MCIQCTLTGVFTHFGKIQTVTLIVSDSTVCLNASVKADSFITARRDFSLIIVNKWTYSFATMTENTLEANTIYSQLNRTKL